MALENLFIRVPPKIGTIQVDTVLVEEHTNSVLITKNPVEAGSDITDHAIIEPKILTIQGAITDTPLGAAAFGQLIDSITGLFGTSTATNITRSKQAYEALLVLMETREPIEISTRLRVYPQMLITGLTTSQDKDSSRIVNFNMTLEEILITESETLILDEQDVADSVRKNATSTVEKGRKEAVGVSGSENSSLITKLGKWLGG